MSVSAPDSATIEQVINAFHQVRASLAESINEAGADPSKTRESARHLDLNRGLMWRISRIIRCDDLAAAASDVPGRSSIGKVIEACRMRGASEETLDGLAQAVAAYEAAVGLCSGDKKTLAMLVASRGAASSSIELDRSRRKFFEGSCAVWGVQAQIRFVTAMVFPSDSDSSMLDVTHATGYLGFRRLRSVSWPLSYEGVHEKHGEAIRFEKEPLDPEGSSEGELQIISQFCNPPRPEIEVVTSRKMRRFELAAGPVGNAGATDIVFGTYLKRLFPNQVTEEHNYVGFYVLLETPVELLIFDLYAHESLREEFKVETYLLDRMTHAHEPKEFDFDAEILPAPERAMALTPGSSGSVTAHIPWYPRLIELMCARSGRRAEEFLGSRYQIAFPPIGTSIHRRFPLPDASGASPM